MHGSGDQVTDVSGSIALFDKSISLSPANKHLCIYPGAHHGLLFGEGVELGRRVWNEILAWLEKRVELNSSNIRRSSSSHRQQQEQQQQQ
jgi:alpha-beta hydrolase superfamily lysophospholipase